MNYIATMPRQASTLPLYWMALGAFAIGTESLMIAALLPALAGDLGVSLQAAGQLVTAFALTYAVSSPLLTILTGGLERRKLLIGCMVVFAIGNGLAAVAPTYGGLIAARILLAAAAGLYVPNANAIASALVAPERRGRALAIVTGGLSLAVALGVPLGALIGGHLGWRATFAGVGVLACVALVGLVWGVPRHVGAGMTTASLRDRLAVIRHPGTLPALLVTLLWATGNFTVYTYLAVVLEQTAGIGPTGIGLVLFGWGCAAFAGLVAGGQATDRIGPQRVITAMLPMVTIALASLSLIAQLLPPALAVAPVLVAVVVWGAAGWGFFPAQQTRLIGLTGVKVASVILSLNASFQYAGFALGAMLGACVLAVGPSTNLGWVGGACVATAAALDLMLARRRARVAAPQKSVDETA